VRFGKRRPAIYRNYFPGTIFLEEEFHNSVIPVFHPHAVVFGA